MKHIVVWSGGMDSTLILCDLVKKGVDVETIVFETDLFGTLKREFEERARLDIMQYLKKNIRMSKVKLDFPSDRVKGYKGGMFQQPAMIALTTVFGEHDSIYYFGYHKGDDFFSAQYKLLKASECLLDVMGSKNIRFSFPLRFSTKEDIVNTLENMGIASLCHFCEYPNTDYKMSGRCNECTPCRTYEDAKTLGNIHKRNGMSYIAILNYEFGNE